jgi:hypothetical protein
MNNKFPKINFDIMTTSNKTALVQAIVLRENQNFRITYIPQITDRDDGWNESVSGCFLAQRKGSNDSWEDYGTINLSKLKKGEWTKFELTGEEWLNAINYAGE